MNKLQTIDLPGRLWKLEIAEKGNGLGFEFRNEEELQATFAYLDDSRKLWGPFEMPESWWVTLDAVVEGKLLIRSYEDHTNPTSRKLWLLEVVKNEILWEAEKFLPADIIDGKLYGGFVEDGERKPAFIELESGEAQWLGEEIKIDPKNGDNPVKIAHYAEDSEYFEKIRVFIEKKAGDTIQKGVDYFQSDAQIVISYYIYEEECLINKLHIYDRKGALLLESILAENLPNITLQSFFVVSDQLIFVNRHNQLCIYDL
ncbi:DUF4905 domain-containing protein [Persicobacter sp. CCB-QB2]|uniref:DUF4905 domain-containing protein n=1 Tax=Persicobacter sp. CCB-QB2 TaxID=1561025 RepID=UPI0006A94F1E|nr:DUF4905 domain-containing protein [Persicobacter sp. CCB-QB2]